MKHREFKDEDEFSARDGPLATGGNKPSLFIGAHAPMTQDLRTLTCLTCFYIFQLLVSLAVGLGAAFAYYQIQGNQLFAVICFIPIPVLSSVVCLVGARQSKQDLEDKDEILSRVKQIVGEDVLLLGFYLSLYAFAGMAILGVSCGFYQNQVRLVLTAEAADPGIWELRHSGYTLDALVDYTQGIYQGVAALCVLYATLSFFTFYILTVMSVDNETTHVLLQAVDSVLVYAGIFLAFAAGFTYKVSSDLSWSVFPELFLKADLAIAACSILMAIYGFFVGKSERQSHIVLYTFLTFLVLTGLGLLLVQELHQIHHTQDSTHDDCLEAMELLDTDYLQHLGCAHKYSSQSESILKLQCPKINIRRMWELDFRSERKADSYGCLNVECCGYIVATTQTVLDYILATLATLMCLNTLAIFSACALSVKLAKRGPALFHTADTKIGLSILALIVFGPALIYAALPLTPVPKPDLEPNILVLYAGVLPSQYHPDLTLCVLLPSLNLTSDLLECKCEEAVLKVSLWSNDGELRTEDVYGVDLDSGTGHNVVIQGSDLDRINAAVQSVALCESSITTPGSVNITISRLEYTLGNHSRRVLKSNTTSTKSLSREVSL